MIVELRAAIYIVLSAATLLVLPPARAQTSNADFQQAVAAYQQSPSDTGAEKVIRMAAAMDQLPPIPEEARRHFVRGTALFKDAKSPDDYKQVIDEFRQAARLAPWWPDARFNWALAQEAAGEYDRAIVNVKLYLLFKLPDADARAAQDKIYALEAKQEKAAKTKQEENPSQVVAAREQNRFEDLLRRINGRRYIWTDRENPDRPNKLVIDIDGRFFQEGEIWDRNMGGMSAGYHHKQRWEIQGRVTKRSYSGGRYSFEETTTISEGDETIIWHRLDKSDSGERTEEELVYQWQK